MLPVQVAASSIKMTCGPGSHMSSENAAELPHSHHESVNDHANHDHSTDGVTGEISGADQTGMNGTFKGSYCSACAACCIGAVAVSAIPDWSPSSSSVFAPVLASVPSLNGFIPPGPERPPRPFAI